MPELLELLKAPCLVLAPMEGVTDFPMRDFQTRMGGFDFCVSEFFRISQDIPPHKTFREFVPELATGSRTSAQIPVHFQLLGGNAEKLALAALRAVEAGARSIDMNFGCPSPTVNGNDGGATLLKFPNRIREIMETLRKSLPPEIPVSAKLRLGWDDPSSIFQNAESAILGGAQWITIHARTRSDAYRPPAHWSWIGRLIRELRPTVPVIANGDLWTFEAFQRCQEESQTEHFMLGRSALRNPYLALQISRALGRMRTPHPSLQLDPQFPFDPEKKSHWRKIFLDFNTFSLKPEVPESYRLRRMKQWLNLSNYSKPIPWWDTLKRAETLAQWWAELARG